MPTGPPTEQEIWKISRRTIDIIQNHIGADNDIDIVITIDLYGEIYDPEEIKETIVAVDDRYYLQPSKRPEAEYQILYCRLPGWATGRRCVKVDILIPPTLHLPEILSNRIILIDDIPVMPLFDLLVMKLQGWRDHINSSRPDFRAKLPNDVFDVRALLDRAVAERIWYPKEKRRHTREFMERATRLALGFIPRHGGRAKFLTLGFQI
ncbi:hypothetical protein B0F90DRAFT_1777821 [Multifurca ochricompacta]|uniref:Uncharacterized protein n=1 Tax=Multifurca ochricompacta TaxID=376703 RepID=A0AAD4QJ80_9AGAM|nr:hypothetical protein B0F90DRAFT_1777821 [Multifurca ochricompacta]